MDGALVSQIDTLTNAVRSGTSGLEDALHNLEAWIDHHADDISPAERKSFSGSLDMESSNDNRSLIDSVLKLHTARLLYRLDARNAEEIAEPATTAYAQAREAFSKALQHSEETINEVRIDVAIANAHHLLGDAAANRRWLDHALERLPDLAAVDLVEQAQTIPALEPPRMTPWKRFGLRWMGVNLERLAERSRADLATIAQMQTNQIVILAHLVGVSLETVRERQRANRAFRTAAYLITRHNGLPGQEDASVLLDIAEAIRRAEPEAARILARQALSLCESEDDTACVEKLLQDLS
jgi:tetratricopeptide (TPR) repeat protein